MDRVRLSLPRERLKVNPLRDNPKPERDWSHNRGANNKGGRKPGIPNKITTRVLDAVLTAAAEIGYDQKGQDGLVGFIKKFAEDDPRVFVTALLSKAIPSQMRMRADVSPITVFHLPPEVLSGMSYDELVVMEKALGGVDQPKTIDADPSDFARILGE